MKEKIFGLMDDFSSQAHGASGYDQDKLFIMGKNDELFLPLSFLVKKTEDIKDVKDLQKVGFVCSSYTYFEFLPFEAWYQKTFNKKLMAKDKKMIKIVHFPDQAKISETVSVVNQIYEILKKSHVIMNGKNLPVQLGEWYAKLIFGLHQIKSSSQRGFDFYTENNKKVEVKIDWHDATGPKGVKIKKSLIELSDYTIIMYVAKNFTIRDIIFLDSDFIVRKYSTKGHTIFLKDSDVGNYFFSKSDKHLSKVVNTVALMKFSSPSFAMKLSGRLKDS
ncbi:hypothetical protein N9N67_07885 [Bacteriovoracaceae bacterium]|nr:hypothetical protein [Bacteriovoracaceae bacterium]